MSNIPTRSIPFYIIVSLFLSLSASSVARAELTEMQKQARIYRLQGYSLQKAGKLQAALAFYEKALYIDPAYPALYNDVGIVEESLGDKDKAKEVYLKAIEVAPEYPNTYTNLALLYEGEKDYAKAVVCWIKRSVLGPSGDPWRDIAQRRLSDIQDASPQAYAEVKEKFADNLRKGKEKSQTVIKTGYLSPEGQKVSLFTPERKPAPKPAEPEALDSKQRAANYLASAKESYNRKDYVVALKEATVSGYLDPSNSEISDFVEKVRKKLLQ